MALAGTSNAAPTYSNINLVPLRVNVVSDDHTITLVDTLVLDRYCWPIPLFEPVEDAIERNANELAYMLVTDTEVQGMGRTVRHFTNRVDLWSESLQNKIKQQLIPQLRHVAKTTKLRVVKKKFRKPSSADEEEEKETNKRKREEESTAQDTPPATEERSKKHKKASPVPVRLRLCVNGIRIHDDFIWDLSVPQCPIEFAKSLGKDLNLPDEAVAAVVTSIVEQLDGSMVDDTKDMLDSADVVRKNATGAWPLDHKVHVANMNHLIGLHRPSTTTGTM